MDIFEVVDSAPDTDPISEITRHQRRSLLASCLIAVAVTAGGLVPEEINALGVKLTTREQRGLLALLLLIVAYFLIAFLAYALPEWGRFRVKDKLFKQRVADYIKPYASVARGKDTDPMKLEQAIIAAGHAKLAGSFIRGAAPRLAVDLWLPCALAVISLTFLTSTIIGIPALSFETPLRSPVLWAFAVIVLLAAGVAGLRYRQKVIERRPLQGIRQLSDDMRGLTEEMRAATKYPEGSPEREVAKRRLEEKLKEFAKRREPPSSG